MSIPSLFFIVVFFFLALGLGIFGLGAWQRRLAPGSLPFALLMFASAISLFGNGLESYTQTLVEKIFWSKVDYLGAVWLGVLWLLFVARFLRPHHLFARRWWRALLVVPAITLVLAWTNEWHGWIWSSFQLSNGPDGLTVHYLHGAWFWLYTAYSYGLLGLGSVWMLRGLKHLPPVRRRQGVLLLIGFGVSVFTNIGYLTGPLNFHGLDLSVVGFLITGLIYLWTLFRWNLLELSPLAFEAILENIGEGYLLFDLHGRLLTVNEVGRDALGLGDAAIGQSAEGLLANWPGLWRLFAETLPARAELTTSTQPPHVYEAYLREWRLGSEQVAGSILVLHEVTRSKQAEESLQENLRQQEYFHHVLQILHHPADMRAALGEVLAYTGQFTGAWRVSLCQNSADDEGALVFAEWANPEHFTHAREGLLTRYAAMPTWRTWMAEKGCVIAKNTPATPPDMADYMATWGVRMLNAYPIYGRQGRVYGFLEMDVGEDPAVHEAQDGPSRLFNLCQIVSGAIARMQIEADEQRQRTLAEALHDTASALNSTLNLEEVFDRILNNLDRVVPHDAASIALVENGLVRYVRWRGYDAQGAAEMRMVQVPLEERRTYREMALTGQPIFIYDTLHDPQWQYQPAYAWIRSYAGMPVQTKGELVGFINVDSREVDSFPRELAYSLRVFAQQAAIAIENARLYDEAHARAEEMSLVYHTGLTLAADLEPEQVQRALYQQCQQALPMDIFSLAMFTPENGEIRFPVFVQNGEAESPLPPLNLHSRGGLTGEVIRRRARVYIPDLSAPEASAYAVIRTGGRPARSYVGVPLVVNNTVMGVMAMQSFHPDVYTAEQMRLFETIGVQAAIALQNALLYQQMRQFAITDMLTGMVTRRHFLDLGQGEVQRAAEKRRPLSVLMIDIDHFKRVNDSYGHILGDEVLKRVAQCCMAALRETDVAGRWGGEEFTALLPDADLGTALLVAERVRAKVAEEVLSMPNGDIRITISVGIAVLEPACSTLAQLIECADAGLFTAKHSGRNQVRVGDPF